MTIGELLGACEVQRLTIRHPLVCNRESRRLECLALRRLHELKSPKTVQDQCSLLRRRTGYMQDEHVFFAEKTVDSPHKSSCGGVVSNCTEQRRARAADLELGVSRRSHDRPHHPRRHPMHALHGGAARKRQGGQARVESPGRTSGALARTRANMRS